MWPVTLWRVHGDDRTDYHGFYSGDKLVVDREVYETLHALGEPIDLIVNFESGATIWVRVKGGNQLVEWDNTVVLSTGPIPDSEEVPPEYRGAWALSWRWR